MHLVLLQTAGRASILVHIEQLLGWSCHCPSKAEPMHVALVCCWDLIPPSHLCFWVSRLSCKLVVKCVEGTGICLCRCLCMAKGLHFGFDATLPHFKWPMSELVQFKRTGIDPHTAAHVRPRVFLLQNGYHPHAF